MTSGYESVRLRKEAPAVVEGSGHDEQSIKKRNVVAYYFSVCFLFAMILIGSAIFNETYNFDGISYQILMFLICSGPFFFMGSDPRHRLLAIFMVCYYLIFGMASFVDIVFGLESASTQISKKHFKLDEVILSLSDLVVIVGGLSFLAGYFSFTKLRGKKSSTIFMADWKPHVLLVMALVIWAIGLTISIAYNMIVTPMYIPTHVLGIPLSIASNMRLLSPVASIMLIYLAARSEYKSGLVWTILSIVIIVEFVIGFAANSKEISYRIPALLILGLYFMHGSINKKILLIVFFTTIPYMLFFDAYRNYVLQGVFNKTQTEALESFDDSVETVMESTSGVDNIAGKSLESLKNRFNGKTYIDIIVVGTSSGGVPFIQGESLYLFLTTFIPRTFWPDKPNPSIGQMFNKAFHISESEFTFIPTTQLGELYWGFAMPGVIFGMLCIGVIFGYLASMFSVGKSMTLPRFLILLVATYYLALRFEVNIAVQYSTFIRILILVIILNWIVKSLGWQRRNYSNTTE